MENKLDNEFEHMLQTGRWKFYSDWANSRDPNKCFINENELISQISSYNVQVVRIFWEVKKSRVRSSIPKEAENRKWIYKNCNTIWKMPVR